MGFLRALKSILVGKTTENTLFKKNSENVNFGPERLLKKPVIRKAISTPPEKSRTLTAVSTSSENPSLSTSFDYATATKRILNKTSMSSAQIDKLISLMQENGHQGTWKQKKLLGELFDNKDFDWPWFDEWLDKFKIEGFPSNPTWASFADEKSWLKITIWDTLKTMKKAELLALAKKKNISTPPKIKVNDLRELLEKRIKRADITEEINLTKSKALTKLKKKQQEDKYTLLALSIYFLASHIHRHKQIVDLMSHSKLKYKVQASPGFDDKVCRKLAKQWSFNSTSTKNIPPFFPGDATDIRVTNLK